MHKPIQIEVHVYSSKYILLLVVYYIGKFTTCILKKVPHDMYSFN